MHERSTMTWTDESVEDAGVTSVGSITTETNEDTPTGIAVDNSGGSSDDSNNEMAIIAPTPKQTKHVHFSFVDDNTANCTDSSDSGSSVETDGDGDDREDATAEEKALVFTTAVTAVTAAHNSNTDVNNSNMGNITSIPNTNTSEQPLTFLIEIVGTTLSTKQQNRFSKTRSSWGEDSRGMHCTTTWVDPATTKRFGKATKREELVLHRTKTLRMDGTKSLTNSTSDLSTVTTEASSAGSDAATKSAKSINTTFVDDGEDEGLMHAEHIFTVDDASLFLFHTSMEQMVNASKNSKDSKNINITDEEEGDNYLNSGGLRFDIFEKPLDALSTVYRTVLADSVSVKEANAIISSDSSSPLLASYRLLGSVFLTPKEILERCDEERFEYDLHDGLRKEQQSKNRQGKSLQRGNDTMRRSGSVGRLALRIRVATDMDIAFIETLQSSDANSSEISIAQLNDALRKNNPDRETLKPVQLITEMDENVLTAQTSLKAISNIAPVAQESMRYLFSNDVEKRVMVKPYPDPNRVEETMWFTEAELHEECWKPSTNWIKAGSGSLGKVYLEVLECRGLPNVDTGPGNKTDAFVSVVYEDVMVQTEVIDDSLSPMWMPWTNRAYIFQMNHPSTAMYIGVADYDVGPLEHECIGRCAIQLSKLSPGTLYTLSYNLYESSNLTEKGESSGTIILRLRVEYDEKKYLMEGWKTPPVQWVNSQQWKSHRVAKYCCDGPHDTEVFEMKLFRSHINELLTAKRTLTYVIGDSLHSLIFWRGQVKVGNTWLPLHSAIVFSFSVHAVEKPQLLPSFFFFACGWIMISSMCQRESHPSPWHRGHSFYHYWNILLHGKSFHVPQEIRPLQGHKEALKYEKAWQDRLVEDDARWAKQAELDAKVKGISDDTVIRTKAKAKANAPLVDPISAMAGARLLPYQQRLGRYCDKVRYVRNVMNWSESVMSFWYTVGCIGAGIFGLFVPWAFLIRWTSRLIVWICLGPWMKGLDIFLHGLTVEEEVERQKMKSSNQIKQAFQLQCKAAKTLRENTLKLKAFRVRLFGKYITRLPEYNLTRHEDVPLPESTAEPYCGSEIKPSLIVPGQNLTGVMIPNSGRDLTSTRATASEEKKKKLIEHYQQFSEAQQRQTISMPIDNEVVEGFELVKPEEGQITCVPSEKEQTRLVRRLSSGRDPNVSERELEAALDSPLQKGYDPTKQKRWVFSASIQLSFKQESADNRSDLELCDDRNGRKMIQYVPEEIEEEGVEIIPLLGMGSNLDENESPNVDEFDDNARVSVLYVKG